MYHLAIKLYKITHVFNIKVVIKTILEMIQEFVILLILCTNFPSLYDYLVKLAITLIK